MRVFLKFILIIGIFSVFSSSCFAGQTRILVAPVSLQTVNSTVGLYPNTSDYIANDLINDLNKNILYDVLDLNSAESLVMSHGLWSKYRTFLSNYKDRGIIDYKFCGLLHEKLGIHKLVLISSGFSMQSMMFKRPFLYRIGLIELEPVQSYYRMNISFAMIDTQNGLIDFERKYNKNFKVKNFEVPSNSLSDNALSTEEIKKFSGELANAVFTDVCITINQAQNTNVRSSIISDLNSREGSLTRDGHFYLSNKQHLSDKRKTSFKNWIKERLDF